MYCDPCSYINALYDSHSMYCNYNDANECNGHLLLAGTCSGVKSHSSHSRPSQPFAYQRSGGVDVLMILTGYNIITYRCAGNAFCPHYAKAERLAEELQHNLPDFSVRKIPVHPEDWLVCRLSLYTLFYNAIVYGIVYINVHCTNHKQNQNLPFFIIIRNPRLTFSI